MPCSRFLAMAATAALTVATVPAWAASPASGAATVKVPAANTITLPAARVRAALDAGFPHTFALMGGLAEMTASDPTLEIPASGERIHLQFDASASVAGSQVLPVGRVWLSSAVRWDPSSLALFLQQPSVERVQPAGGGELADQDLQLVSLLLQDYAREQPLYRLDPSLLQALGPVRVQSVHVREGAIVITFDQPVGMPDLEPAP